MAESKKEPLKKEEIPTHPDNKIDQDFKGFPSGPANETTINPGSPEEGKTAALDIKDGEKKNIPPEVRKSIDEQESDGSANAFEDK